MVLYGIFAYVLLSLLIGIIVSRTIRTEDDYLVAGRSLGYTLSTFTIFATWFGAETCIGAAGAIYENGLSGGTADPFGYGLCLFVMGLVFAVPLWKLRLTTLADLFRHRFSHGVERLAVLMLVPTSMLWAAAQIRAFGQVISASSGLEVSLTITMAAAVVIAYTMFGGLLADAWTDVIQGIALIIGLIILVAAFMTGGGAEQLAAIHPDRLDPFGGETVLGIIESWAIPVVGSVVAAELVSRIIAAKNPTVARRSSLLAGIVYLGIGIVPVTIGLAGFQLLPDLAEPEQILPIMAQRYLPPVLYMLFAGALVSAILSTVDSALLVASGLVSHNLIFPIRPNLSEGAKVRIARGGVLVFGIVAYVAALYARGVYHLVEEASEFGSAGIFIVVVFGLFTRLGGVASAYATLVTGIVLWFLGAYVLGFPYPYLTSLGGALAAYLGGIAFEAISGPTRFTVRNSS